METEFKLDESRLEVLKKLVLQHGAHKTFEGGVCAMEAVAFLAGEPHTDAPKCSSMVLGRFVIALNDRWGEGRRQQLKPYLIRLVGTAAGVKVERRRAFMCADWAVRECLPMALEAAKVKGWPERLRALPEIMDRASADAGRDMARKARDAAYAAYAAAYADAAYAAYAAAAYAAYAAADAAAADAAYAAYAAYAAAYAADAAYAAAAADARPRADASALALLDRLIKISPGPFEGGAP